MTYRTPSPTTVVGGFLYGLAFSYLYARVADLCDNPTFHIVTDGYCDGCGDTGTLRLTDSIYPRQTLCDGCVQYIRDSFPSLTRPEGRQ